MTRNRGRMLRCTWANRKLFAGSCGFQQFIVCVFLSVSMFTVCVSAQHTTECSHASSTTWWREACHRLNVRLSALCPYREAVISTCC